MEGLDLQDLAWQGVYIINVAQDIIDVPGYRKHANEPFRCIKCGKILRNYFPLFQKEIKIRNTLVTNSCS